MEAFCKALQPPPATSVGRFTGLEPLEPGPCEHCGYQPGSEDDSHVWLDSGWLEVLAPTSEEEESSDPSGRPAALGDLNAEIALAWFPASEWQKAIEMWPDLLDERPAEHDAYSKRLEATIKLSGELGGHRLYVSPLTVAELQEAALTKDEADTDSSIRAACAAEVLRQGRAIKWPPGRNFPCWCGSGRKYKRCCGPMSAAKPTDIVKDQ